MTNESDSTEGSNNPPPPPRFLSPLKTGTGTTTKVDKPQFVPKQPKFGGITEVDTDKYAVWTGGEPKPDWKGLKEPKPTTIAPTQYRPTSITSQTKNQYYRTLGLEPKFKRDGDLLTLQK